MKYCFLKMSCIFICLFVFAGCVQNNTLKDKLSQNDAVTTARIIYDTLFKNNNGFYKVILDTSSLDRVLLISPESPIILRKNDNTIIIPYRDSVSFFLEVNFQNQNITISNEGKSIFSSSVTTNQTLGLAQKVVTLKSNEFIFSLGNISAVLKPDKSFNFIRVLFLEGKLLFIFTNNPPSYR